MYNTRKKQGLNIKGTGTTCSGQAHNARHWLTTGAARVMLATAEMHIPFMGTHCEAPTGDSQILIIKGM